MSLTVRAWPDLLPHKAITRYIFLRMGWRTSRSVRRIWMCSNLGHPYEEIGSSQCPGIATAPPKGAIQGRDPGNSIILKPDEAFGGCDTTTAHEMSLGTAQPNLQPRIYMLCHGEGAGYIGNLATMHPPHDRIDQTGI